MNLLQNMSIGSAYITQCNRINKSNTAGHTVPMAILNSTDSYLLMKSQYIEVTQCLQEGQHPLTRQRADNFRQDLQAT